MIQLFVLLITLPMQIIAPIILPFVLPFARKLNEPSPVQRYRLPNAFMWLETPDEHLPGGLYEPAVYSVYRRFGWFVCSWYWLGIRNVAFGLAWQFGKPAKGYMAVMTEQEKAECGVYENVYHLLFLKLLVGYAVYKDCYSVKTNNGFWAVPRISLRFA